MLSVSPGRSLSVSLLVLAGAISACDGSSSQGPSKSCDPLADDPRPITLGKVLGVGRDGQGVVYVIDQPPQGSDRLFVSDGMVLKRQPVAGLGAGAVADGGMFEIVSSGSGDTALAVQVVIDSTGVATMGVVHGALTTKTFTIGQQGETLVVLGADALSSYSVENLPGTIDVEYVATLADGRTLVVTRPDVDWSFTDFRVFLSAVDPSSLLERKVIDVVRGSFTNVIFDLDGMPATAHFTSSLSPGPSTLTVGAGTSELTVLSSGTRPTGVTFLCL